MNQLPNCLCGGKAKMFEYETPPDGHWMGSDGYTEYKIQCSECCMQTRKFIGRDGRKHAEEKWTEFMLRYAQPKTIEKSAPPVNITIEKEGSSTEKLHPVDAVLGRVPKQKPKESHTLLIPREEAIEIIKDDHEDWMQVETKIESQSRWQTFYIGIYKHKPTNKFYTVDFTRGSTENQDSEYFYIDPVNFEEVEIREKIVEQYVKIEERINDRLAGVQEQEYAYYVCLSVYQAPDYMGSVGTYVDKSEIIHTKQNMDTLVGFKNVLESLEKRYGTNKLNIVSWKKLQK